MVSLSRTLPTTSIFIPKHLKNQLQLQQPQPDQPFFPFSQLQQRKILESQLLTILHDSNNLNQIKQVHAHIVRKGLDQCCYVLAKFIRMLTKIGVPMDPYARLVFKQVKYPNPFLYTALIRGYTCRSSFLEAVRVYSSMRMGGIDPVSFTFTALLKACTAAVDVNLGM